MGEDHPRSRGVYRTLSEFMEGAPGSSPLARGLLRWQGARRAPRRIIPARAGFTQGHGVVRTFMEDHPRSRGVYGFLVVVVGVLGGSSPLARGLRSPVQ